MAETPFITIAKNATAEVNIKKSRFICNVARVNSEEEAKDFIAGLQKEHRKANHNCFAYMVGDKDQVQRESDNGEPSGTAGVPILEALKLVHVHNVCAVVTRYFGGIKLGAGGLIRAYSNTTTAGIEAAGLVQRIKQKTLILTVDYATHDQLTYFLKQEKLTIANEEYGVDVKVTIYVDEDRLTEVTDKLRDHFNDRIPVTEGDSLFREVPYVKQS